MSFQDVLYPTCAAINYAIAAGRIPTLLRSRRDLNSMAFVGSFVALGTTFTLSTPAVWVHFDAMTGLPNSAGVLAQCLVIAYTVCMQFVLLSWDDPATATRRVRWRLALALVTIAAMATLFVLADLTEQQSRDWMAHVTDIPLMAVYVVIYLITFAIGRVDVIRLCTYYAPSSRRWLRRGLWWTAAGSVCGLLYVVARAADVIAPYTGLDPLKWEAVAGLSTVACTLLTMIGLTMPSWGPVMSRPADWVRQYRDFRNLHTLWAEVTAPFPAVRLADIVPAHPLPMVINQNDIQY